MSDSASNPFSDLDDYIALPRVDGLAVSPDGSRVVLSVSTLDPKKTAYRRALWSVDADGGGAPHRLTRSAKGEAGAAFTASGDLLFVSGRPDADVEDGPNVGQLWVLPAAGGEARPLTSLQGGVDAVAASATDSGTVILSAPVLKSATSLEDDAERRKNRDDKKVTAILHDSFPIRYWDHDLGPAETHLLALEISDDNSATPRDLTPHPSRSFDEAGTAVSPDGGFVVATSGVQEQRGSRSTILRIDTASGESTTILDKPDVDLENPALSADGMWLAYIRSPRSTRTSPADLELWVSKADGTDARRVAADWDRWPSSLAFTADGTRLVVTADQHGRGPIFAVDLASDVVTQLTDDDFTYSSVAVARNGRYRFALRASWLAPNHPVRIELATGEITVLATPAELPPVPAAMTEVEAAAEDGTPLRSWLLLPKDATGPVPMLLWIHGGPLNSWNAWSWRWNPLIMVERGYAVLLPDPALSTGYGLDFIRRGWGAWGDKPFTDLMAITDVAEARPDIDETKVAAMGGSFGGYMANWIAGHTDRFAAIVSHASLWALDQFTGTTDSGYYWQREFSPEAAAAHSPHLSVADIRTPMLVVHGDNDYRVPIGESLRLWAELAEHHASPDGASDHRLLVFPDENHWVLKPQNAIVWYETVLAFLDQHVHGKDWVRPEALG